MARNVAELHDNRLPATYKLRDTALCLASNLLLFRVLPMLTSPGALGRIYRVPSDFGS